MHQKFIQNETTIYMLFGASKIKFATEAPPLLNSLRLHWAVERLKKKGQKEAVKINFFRKLHTKVEAFQRNPCQRIQIYKQFPDSELLHPFYCYLEQEQLKLATLRYTKFVLFCHLSCLLNLQSRYIKVILH